MLFNFFSSVKNFTFFVRFQTITALTKQSTNQTYFLYAFMQTGYTIKYLFLAVVTPGPEPVLIGTVKRCSFELYICDGVRTEIITRNKLTESEFKTL